MNYLFLSILIVSTHGFNFWDVFIGSLVTITDYTTGPEDAKLNISQLANKYGYPLETHVVITEDGYVLNMHRMPYGRNATSNGKAVFLMHGIWESSDSWLLQGPHKALAYNLADAGYDVWMGNARGNLYAENHVNFNMKLPNFWAYSWEEIGLYDLPAMIDYALDYTGEESLYYVGFSQGTTTYFVMNSMKPEYNKKIKMMFALAPEVFLGNAKSTLVTMFSPAHSYLESLLTNFNVYSPGTSLFRQTLSITCKILSVGCDSFFVAAYGKHHVKSSMLTVILGHSPTGSSTLQFIHYGQLAYSKRFCRYDFGVKENIKRYGQKSPPDYDLGAVTTPVVLFSGDNDKFADRIDVNILKCKIPNVIKSYIVKQYTHLDFMYADDSTVLINSNILQEMNNWERSQIKGDDYEVVFMENNLI